MFLWVFLLFCLSRIAVAWQFGSSPNLVSALTPAMVSRSPCLPLLSQDRCGFFVVIVMRIVFFCCQCPHGLHSIGGYSAGLCRPDPPKQPSHHSSWLTGHPAVDLCHPCFYHDMTLFVNKPQGRCTQASPSSPKQTKHKSRTSFLRSVLARSLFETESEGLKSG